MTELVRKRGKKGKEARKEVRKADMDKGFALVLAYE